MPSPAKVMAIFLLTSVVASAQEDLGLIPEVTKEALFEGWVERNQLRDGEGNLVQHAWYSPENDCTVDRKNFPYFALYVYTCTYNHYNALARKKVFVQMQEDFLNKFDSVHYQINTNLNIRYFVCPSFLMSPAPLCQTWPGWIASPQRSKSARMHWQFAEKKNSLAAKTRHVMSHIKMDFFIFPLFFSLTCGPFPPPPPSTTTTRGQNTAPGRINSKMSKKIASRLYFLPDLL